MSFAYKRFGSITPFQKVLPMSNRLTELPKIEYSIFENLKDSDLILVL